MASSNVCNESLAVVHGLRLRTPFEVWPGSALAERQWSHQLNVDVSPAREPTLCGEIVADYVEHGERLYTFARSGRRTDFVFPGLCSGWFDLELERIELCTDDASLATLVLPNTIVAVLLQQIGDLALHGSAIHLAGGTLAFCGPSTAGKTTCAAALTLTGAMAVTDDLLRVELPAAHSAVCFPGIPEFRLRATAGWGLPDACIRPLADERTGFTPQRIDHEKSALNAIFFPISRPHAEVPELLPIKGQAAVRRLLQSSRIAWTPRAGHGFLRQLSVLAERVELYELHLDLTCLKHAWYREHLARLLHCGLEGAERP